jgi:N-acetylmuramoyl-L-alanine amidase
LKQVFVKTAIFLAFFSLIFTATALYAQESSPAGFRVFTLDETLNKLYPADSKEQKEFHWDPFFREGSFSIGGHYGAFSTALSAGQRGFLMVDNRDIYTVFLPYQDKGELVFPEQFVNTARDALARSISEDSSHYRIAAIIIDPGHGGSDPGAVGTHTINGKSQKINEKDIVLKSAKLLRDMLVRAYPDKRILMTRESDITTSLEERTVIANSVPIRKNEAIIYISIHANSSRDKNAKGYEVWHLKHDFRRNLLDETQFSDSPDLRKIMNLLTEEAYNAESIRIAESILGALKTSMGKSMPSRGLKEEDWFVVRRSHMPAVLVELGFVSNRDDTLLMTSDDGLHKLTEALYKGIAEFVGDFERSGGFIAAR